LMAAMSMTCAFLVFTSLYGFYLNFAIPLWIFILIYLAASFTISYQYFMLLTEKKKLVFSYSVIIGLAMAQIGWIVNFWPFGYLTTGVIVLMLYYVFWDLTQSYLLGMLSKTRVVANIIFFSLLIMIVLLSSRWMSAQIY